MGDKMYKNGTENTQNEKVVIPTAKIPTADIPNSDIMDIDIPKPGHARVSANAPLTGSESAESSKEKSKEASFRNVNLPKIENEMLARILKLVVIFLAIAFVMYLIIPVNGKRGLDDAGVQNEQSAGDEIVNSNNDNSNNEDSNNTSLIGNTDASVEEEEIDLSNKTDDEIAEIVTQRVIESQNTVSETAAPASDFTYEQRNGCIYITKYNGLGEELEIPAVIDGVNVCGISGHAFAENIYLKKVVLPDTILYIDGTAFENAQKLEEVVCSANLTIVGDNAFRGCSALKSFVCKGGGESSLRFIGVDVFAGCTSLQHVEIQTDIYKRFEFGVRCFKECTALETITVNGARLEQVDLKEEVFYGCTGITEIPFSEKIVNMGRYAFSNCSNLTHIELPNVVGVDRGAFENCTSLTAFHVPATAAYVGDYAFQNCTSLSTVTFEDGASTREEGNTICVQAFCNTAITEVEIPSSYTRVQFKAFGDCPNFKKFVWHNSGKNVLNQILEENTFEGNANLTEVYLPGTLKEVGRGWENYPNTVVIYALEGSVGHTLAVEKGYNWQPWTE